MKKLFLLCLIMLLAVGCQQEDALIPVYENPGTMTRSGDVEICQISGPGSISYNGYGIYTVSGGGLNWRYTWESNKGDLDHMDEITLNVRLDAYTALGWVQIKVYAYDEDDNYRGYGYKEVYSYGGDGYTPGGNPGGSGPGGNPGEGDEEQDDGEGR